MNKANLTAATAKRNRYLIMMALESGPASINQISELTGLASIQAARHMSVLRTSKPKMVYISDHTKVRGKGSPIFSLGDKPDAVFVGSGLPSWKDAMVVDHGPVIPTTPQTWLSSLGL